MGIGESCAPLKPCQESRVQVAYLVADAGRLSPHPTSSLSPLRRVGSASRYSLDLSRIGVDTGRKAWLKERTRAARLLQQSRVIADALERVGLQGYREDRDVTEIDLVTLEATTAHRAFVNTNVIPVVMLSNTRQMTTQLMAYCRQRDCGGTMLVFGSIWCSVEELRGTIKARNRLASKIAAYIRKAYKSLGVDLIFANTEVVFKRENGVLMFHVHCHVLIEHPFMDPASYKAFVADVKRFLPMHYGNTSGMRPETAKEAVKYCFSPEKGAAYDLSDQEWADVAGAFRKMRFYRPMGGFRVWRRQFQAEKAPGFVMPSTESVVLTGNEAKDRRAICRAALAEARSKPWLSDAAAVKDYAREQIKRGWEQDVTVKPASRLALVVDPSTGETMVHAVPRRSGVEASYAAPDPDRDRTSGEDIVLSIAAPAPCFSSRMTPRLLVMNRSKFPVVDMLRHRGLLRFADTARAIYNARVPEAERLPMLDQASLQGRRWRVVQRGGQHFAVSEEAEQVDAAKKRAALKREQELAARSVMQHKTTITVSATKSQNPPPVVPLRHLEGRFTNPDAP